MKIKNIFKTFSKFELRLWLSSLFAVVISYLLSGSKDILSLIASVIGATALIFVSKGHVFGQVLTVIFAVFYGIISYFFRYYGEMITYLCMTSPIAVMSVISWIKHPYKDTAQVRVNKMKRRQIKIMLFFTAIVTFIFYFILKALGTANLIVSTISVATSFSASYLTFMRSELYALFYAANDVVLITLWILASITDIKYLPMIFCFTVFLINDVYGFFNWKRMRKSQK